MSTQLYELKFTATGEVRDTDGNLISQEPVEATATLTEDQVRDFLASVERQAGE